MAIKLEYVKVANYTKSNVCPHNAACRCGTKECHKCGWNPKVAQLRLEKLRQRLLDGGKQHDR